MMKHVQLGDSRTPRVLYLILSHTNPEQLVRLVSVLREGSAGPIVVHHHVAGAPLAASALRQVPDARLVPWTEPVRWGDFSVLRRMVAALAWAVRYVEYDWLVLLSGQDYPVRPLSELERTLAQAGCDAFLEGRETVSLTGGAPAQGDFESDNRLWYFYRHLPVPLVGGSAAARALLRAARHRWRNVRPRGLPLWYVRDMPHAVWLGARRRSTPYSDGFRCLKGSDWFAVSSRAVEMLVRVWKQERDLVRHYSRCISPSESFFHTVLCNSPKMRVRDDNLRYISWPPDEAREPSPRTLTIADLDSIVASGKLLARKFDTRVDVRVLEELDRRLRTL
jgi:hypothetical protein